MKNTTILALCLLLFSTAKAQQNSLPQLRLAHFADGFDAPMDIANCGDSRLFVAERLGKIWILDSAGNKLPEPFLDITDKVFTVYPNEYDERGLLGMAFHPSYPDSPYIYVNYIGHDSNSHVSRFTVNPNNPNKAMSHSQYMLLTVQQPKDPEFVNHKAGCLKFGPDGYLYGTFGDGGSAGDPLNNAQNPRTLLGKMFRIDVNKPNGENNKRYSVPSDNPFVNTPQFKDEIWATGLRNPWRFSFDKESGALWLPDVGQDKWEEINLVAANSKGGQNFGWSCYEGNHNYKINGCDYNGLPYTFPIVEYAHSNVNCASITGGYVYRGTQFKKMQGKYFYCDYCTGKFSTVIRNNQTWLNLFLLQSTEAAFATFGEATDGELYVADNTNGIIYHLVDSADIQKIVTPAKGADELHVKLYPNPNHGSFSVDFLATGNETYHIYIENISGRVLATEQRTAVKGNNRWVFNNKLDKGIYILHIQNSRGTVAPIKEKFFVD